MIARLRTGGWQLDLALVGLLTVTAFLAVLASAPTIVRLPLIGVLVLFAPGYAVLSALILTGGLSVLERVGIAIGGSISITVATGLAMGLLGIEFNPVNWASALTLVSLSGLGVAWLRRLSHGVAGPHPVVPGMPLRQAAVLLLAVLVFADVLLVSRVIAGDQLGAPPEQLWMLPADDGPDAMLGMRAGPSGGEYVIRVSSAGSVLEEYRLELATSEVWQQALELTEADRTLPVVARLYAAGSEAELRYVVLQPDGSADDS